jgi:hypothetical protein
MKYVITENQSSEVFLKLIKKLNMKFDIVYWSDNGRDRITGTVYLYKDGEILGYRHGYEFFFKYDSRFNSLTPDEHFPNIENVDVFKFMPPKMVIGFFTDKVETYLKNYIDKGYSGLRRK